MEINSNTHLKKLGDKIALLREKKKMSQYKLAKEIFTDQSNLARIEDGKVNPTVKTLIKISLVLKCKVKDFFDF
ncbi:MAG: helix-turn-helix domain-containing protein [Bacteroidia bacterium]|jgi:transcriptional regulator with XRE-family HTH domain|nr:helix-turn-helix domain-containing protein [Bacteroidia bacterium]